MPCASTRIGSDGTGKRRERDFTNFAEVEPTRFIFVSCEPTETWDVKELVVEGQTTDG
jgi:hypothetical protein